MTTGTDCFASVDGGIADPAQSVFAISDGFQMIGVDATTIPTQVVELQSSRHGPNDQLVQPLVGDHALHGMIREIEPTVSSDPRSRPVPTTVCEGDVIEEAFCLGAWWADRLLGHRELPPSCAMRAVVCSDTPAFRLPNYSALEGACDVDSETFAETATASGDDAAAAFWAAYGSMSTDIQVPGRAAELRVAEGTPTDTRLEPRSDRLGPDWRDLLSRYDDWDVDTMMRIMACESGYDNTAVSPDGRNVGAYQENVIHGYSYAEMTDPVRSTEIAHDIWLSQGYEAWSCY